MAYYATARVFADPFGSFLKGFRQAQEDRRRELALLDQFRRTQLLASGDRRAWEKLFMDEEYRRDTLDLNREKMSLDEKYRRDMLDFDREKLYMNEEYRRDTLDLNREKMSLDEKYRRDMLDLNRDKFEFDKYRFEHSKNNTDVDPEALAEQIYNSMQQRSSAASPQSPAVSAGAKPDVLPPGAVPRAADITRQPRVKPERVTPPAVPSPAGPAKLPPAPTGPTLSDKARARQQSLATPEGLKRMVDEYINQTPEESQDPQQRLLQALMNNPLRKAVERVDRKPPLPVPPPTFASEDGSKPVKIQDRIPVKIQDRIPVKFQDRIPPASVERAIKLIAVISQRLNDPNLSPQARQQLQQALYKAKEIVRRFNQGG